MVFFVQNGILKECFSFVNVPLPAFYPVAETFRLFKEGTFPCKQETSEISTHRGDKKKTLAVSKRGKKNQLTVRLNSFSRRAFFYLFFFCSAASAEVTLRLIQQQPRTREHQQREGKEERERCLLAIAIIVSLLSRCWWKCWSNRRR